MPLPPMGTRLLLFLRAVAPTAKTPNGPAKTPNRPAFYLSSIEDGNEGLGRNTL